MVSQTADSGAVICCLVLHDTKTQVSVKLLPAVKFYGNLFDDKHTYLSVSSERDNLNVTNVIDMFLHNRGV